MTSAERNKKLYAFLVEFTDSNLDAYSLTKDIPEVEDIKSLEALEKFNSVSERIDYIFRLTNLKYIETKKFRDHKTNKDYAIISITENGWKFIEYYENYKKNIKNELFQKKLAKKMLLATIILAIGTSIASIYYLLEIVKNF